VVQLEHVEQLLFPHTDVDCEIIFQVFQPVSKSYLNDVTDRQTYCVASPHSA